LLAESATQALRRTASTVLDSHRPDSPTQLPAWSHLGFDELRQIDAALRLVLGL
jgi:hypothetical protein